MSELTPEALDAIRARGEAAISNGAVNHDLLRALLAALAAARAEVETQRAERLHARAERDDALAELADEQAEAAIQQGRADRAEARVEAVCAQIESMPIPADPGMSQTEITRRIVATITRAVRAALSTAPSVRAAADEHGETGAGL